MKALRQELEKVCNEMYLPYGEGEDSGAPWVEKVGALRFCLVYFVLCNLITSLKINLLHLMCFMICCQLCSVAYFVVRIEVRCSNVQICY